MWCAVVLLFVSCTVSAGKSPELPNKGGILSPKGDYMDGKLELKMLPNILDLITFVSSCNF